MDKLIDFSEHMVETARIRSAAIEFADVSQSSIEASCDYATALSQS